MSYALSWRRLEEIVPAITGDNGFEEIAFLAAIDNAFDVQGHSGPGHSRMIVSLGLVLFVRCLDPGPCERLSPLPGGGCRRCHARYRPTL